MGMILPIILISLLIVVSIGYIIYYFVIYRPYKEKIVKTEISKINNNIKYRYKTKKPIISNVIKSFKLINNATYFSETDIIEENDYISLDLCASHSSGKNMVIDFNGRVYKFNNHAKLKSNFILKKEYFDRSPDNFKIVDTESFIFDKKYNLYADDQEKIFTIFTPVVINKLANLEKYNIVFILGLNESIYFGVSNVINYFEKFNQGRSIKEEYLKQKEYVDYFKELFN